MGGSCGVDIGHWVKTIVLGLGTNTFDVFTDVGTGIHHYPLLQKLNRGSQQLCPASRRQQHLDV